MAGAATSGLRAYKLAQHRLSALPAPMHERFPCAGLINHLNYGTGPGFASKTARL